MHVRLLPYLIPSRRNSDVNLEVRALPVKYFRSPLARAISLSRQARSVRPYPRCSCNESTYLWSLLSGVSVLTQVLLYTTAQQTLDNPVLASSANSLYLCRPPTCPAFALDFLTKAPGSSSIHNFIV